MPSSGCGLRWGGHGVRQDGRGIRQSVALNRIGRVLDGAGRHGNRPCRHGIKQGRRGLRLGDIGMVLDGAGVLMVLRLAFPVIFYCRTHFYKYYRSTPDCKSQVPTTAVLHTAYCILHEILIFSPKCSVHCCTMPISDILICCTLAY